MGMESRKDNLKPGEDESLRNAEEESEAQRLKENVPGIRNNDISGCMTH